MNKIIKDALILMSITLVAGICLGFVYDITKDPIARQEAAAKEEAYKAVFPDMAMMGAVYGELSDEESLKTVREEATGVLEINQFTGAKVEEAYLALGAQDEVLGIVMNVTASEGYGGDINFSIGIKSDGTVNGIEILSISETAGLGMKAADEAFKGQYADKNVESYEVTKTGAAAENQIDAISGATITSNAVTDGVNAGICYFSSLKAEGGIISE